MGDTALTTGQGFNEQIASIARQMLAEPDVEHTLQRAVDLICHILGEDVCASVSLVTTRREIETRACTDPRAVVGDRLQYELGEGPCLDAIWEQETFSIPDLTTSEQYPRWARRVVDETGLRSVVAFQLFTTDDNLGALNLYSTDVGAFPPGRRSEGLALAAHAAVALKGAQDREDFRSALDGRTVIGQAQGILIERYKLTPEKAFAVLTRLSQDSNVKLRDIASHLVTTGDMPAE